MFGWKYCIKTKTSKLGQSLFNNTSSSQHFTTWHPPKLETPSQKLSKSNESENFYDFYSRQQYNSPTEPTSTYNQTPYYQDQVFERKQYKERMRMQYDPLIQAKQDGQKIN
jgi:hypothetical protein